MKKIKIMLGLVCLGLGVCTLSAFKKTIVKVAPPQTQVLKTLNGYDRADALQMIKNFANNCLNDKSKKRFSVWFTKKDLITMNTVLKQELNNPDPVTGVRFYLGSKSCDNTGPHTLRGVTLLVVTTKKQTTQPVTNSVSEYQDYYEHNTNLLNSPMGKPNGKNGIYTAGSVTGNCANPGFHFLKHDSAYRWVRRRNADNGSTNGYNIISDTFDAKFIQSFFDVLINTKKAKFSGLRVYLGSELIKGGGYQDVLVLMPADSKKKDHNGCLEDLGNIVNAKSLGFKQDPGTGDGYDKGELCPETCDVTQQSVISAFSHIKKSKPVKKKP